MAIVLQSRSAVFLFLCVFVFAAATSAKAAEKIKIAALKVSSTGPIYLAQERGYFAKQNLDAEIVFADQPQLMAQAVLSGDIDFSLIGLTAAFFNVAGNGAIHIIGANNDETAGFQSLAVVASDQAYAAGVTSAKELAGHTFAIPAVGGPPQFALANLAGKYGFAYSSLKILQLGTLPNVISAIGGNTAETTIVAGTLARPTLIANQAKLLAWVGDETAFLVTGVATSAKTADTKSDLVNRFLRAYRAGLADYRSAFVGPGELRQDGPDAPAAYEILSKYNGLPVSLIKLGISHINSEGRVDVRSVLSQIAFYKSQGMVKPDIDGTKMIDTRYVVSVP